MRNQTIPRAAALAAALSTIALAPFTAQAQTPSDVNALCEQIRQLDQKLRILERNLELKDEAAVAEAQKHLKITASEGRFEIASADGANSLRLRGLVQVDARFYLDDASAAQDRFVLRRARLIFESKLAERFNYVIQPEFSGSTMSVLDANITASISPTLNLQVGRFKPPLVSNSSSPKRARCPRAQRSPPLAAPLPARDRRHHHLRHPRPRRSPRTRRRSRGHEQRQDRAAN